MIARKLLHTVLGAALLSLLTSNPSLAHEQTGVGGGLAGGLLHPLTGLDHLIAMVAVGIWGAQLGGAAIWILPVVFPLVMAFGAVLGILKVGLPVPELIIALSALVLGLAVAIRIRVPFAVAAIIVAIFAIFHGHAHGVELPTAANPLAYGCGFVVATGLLHACGITIGALARWPGGERIIQGVGAAIAALGGYFLVASLGVAA
ncbi:MULTISPECIES: HupE/UreJ family protein [unclassified Bradyrhizobium]|uniref:HupE/UreJ family protein n=1 Tax=unclassified Bradyrhizobium TaxID=2631580 RepID=UPI002916DACB|nr:MULTISPECIES: HupE/UreJ family protein [unclassified Bradyrhizobium]